MRLVGEALSNWNLIAWPVRFESLSVGGKGLAGFLVLFFGQDLPPPLLCHSPNLARNHETLWPEKQFDDHWCLDLGLGHKIQSQIARVVQCCCRGHGQHGQHCRSTATTCGKSGKSGKMWQELLAIELQKNSLAGPPVVRCFDVWLFVVAARHGAIVLLRGPRCNTNLLRSWCLRVMSRIAHLNSPGEICATRQVRHDVMCQQLNSQRTRNRAPGTGKSLPLEDLQRKRTARDSTENLQS